LKEVDLTKDKEQTAQRTNPQGTGGKNNKEKFSHVSWEEGK